MADVSMAPTRLLGFAGLADIDGLRAAMAAVPGPPLRAVCGPTVAALIQDEPATPLARRGRKALLSGLQAVHRRLEIACQFGPFLPMDPGAACCPASAINALLELSWEDLGARLAQLGAVHQWDLVISWPPEAVLATQRETLQEAAAKGDPALLAQAVQALLRAEHAARSAVVLQALNRHVLAIALGSTAGGETEITTTVLVPRGREDLIEAALGQLPPAQVAGASADLRGPMPPVSFHPVRLTRVEAGDIARSWRVLGLPEKVDLTLLHRQWRALAASAHPDRRPGLPASAEAFTEITEAYRLLRPLLRAEPRTLRSLVRQAGYRLVLPELAPVAVQVVEHAA